MTERFSPAATETGRPDPDTPSTNGRLQDRSSAFCILLIDDNPKIAESLDVAVRLAGHRLDSAAGPEEALSRLAGRRYDAILLDMNYAAGRTNGEEGLRLLGDILAEDPGARVIVVTAHSGIRIAVAAMRAGARDFVMKPWRNADLLAKIAAVVADAGRTAPTDAAAPAAPHEPARLLGTSPAITRVRDLVQRIGPSMAGVVVSGQSGSGRSLVATALHAASTHAGALMVRVDLRDHDAWDRIDDAHGTLLLRHPDRLDEIRQARLLDRLPDTARCIAIADDARSIGPGLARHIAAVEIAVPTLANRTEDILPLARHFLRMAADRHRRPLPHLTPASEAFVTAFRWPDEARGLAGAMERAVLLCEGPIVDVDLLAQENAAPVGVMQSGGVEAGSAFDLDENERLVIEAALREHHHNVTHAATALGLSRGALYRRMTRHGL